MKISACLVIRNEEKLIERCLESIKNVVNEIIIVHDGQCSDKSLEIGKKYKARIFVQPLTGVAEYHRPFSFRKAIGDWILQIDADEFLSQKAQKEIPKLVQTKSVDAYSFSWPYWDGKKYISRGPFSQTLKSCLFRKKKLYILGVAQEYPRTLGNLQKRNDILLEHRPQYDNFNKEIFQKKWINWAKLQAKQISKIEKIPTYNIPNAYENEVFQHYLFLRQHPIWTGLKETIKFFGIYVTRGILWSDCYSLKIAYFELSYLWLVKKYLEYLKYGQKI